MKLIFIDKDTLWCGTQASLESVLAVQSKLLAGDIDISALAGNGEASKPEPSYEVVDGVALISIKGPLLNVDLPDIFARIFGVTTYPGLQRTFAEAAVDDNVKSVLLDVSSPGGSVSGISDTTDALSALRATKPVATFAGDMMASAGYWLGSNADHIIAGKMSIVGSIGVIGTHVEYSREMENQGVKATVLRAGDEKALASPYEPLTEKAKAQMQARLDAVYEQFVEAVAANRKVSYAAALGMADGKEFFGDAAARAGLVDEIGKFPQALAFAKQKVDNGNKRGKIAVKANTEDMKMEDEVIPADQTEQTTAPAAEAVPAATPEAQNSDLVTYLSLQVAEKDAKLRDAAVAAAAVAPQLAAVAGLREIAEASLKQMQIALNSPVADMSALSPEALVAEHSRVAADYAAKFPVGGIAAASADTEAQPAKATAIDPGHLARIQATRMN